MLLESFKYQWKTQLRKIRQYFALRKETVKYKKNFSHAIRQLKRTENRIIPVGTNEVRLFAIFRNESLRLPHFIEYYKQMGVDRFFLVDNNSTDDSKEVISKVENTHIFNTTDTYVNHWYWMEHLLETYGKNHWCVVVDIDELFSFPQAENLSIRDLVNYLEMEETSAIRTFLLDMYPQYQIDLTDYKGGNPLNYIPFFDSSYNQSFFRFLDRQNFKDFTTIIFTGGMRERVFSKINPPHILSKIPLFKNIDGSYLVQGMHAINGAKMSDIQGVVFHTKFLSDFIDEVKEEVKRGEHYGGAFYYKHFENEISKNPEIGFFHEGSTKYVDSRQLIGLGLMKTSEKFEQFCAELKEKRTENAQIPSL